jgi:beta-glucosidase/6-phospho-beta-glucosidase/beta-galactosidase
MTRTAGLKTLVAATAILFCFVQVAPAATRRPPKPIGAKHQLVRTGPTAALDSGFSWAGGIEDTFIPQARPGLRPLDEYKLTHHYGQWRADIDAAASLGITRLRWGVPWYRVEPAHGQFDWSWTDEVIPYMVREKHIEPIIDLVHYGTPVWTQESFHDPRYPEYVSQCAQAFAQRYKDMVKYYTPLNEPAVNADWAGRRGEWPPYDHGDKGYVSVLLPIARGMQLTCAAIRKTDPDAVLVDVEAMRLLRPADASARARRRRLSARYVAV